MKIGDRVRYVGTSWPKLVGKIGTVLSIEKCGLSIEKCGLYSCKLLLIVFMDDGIARSCWATSLVPLSPLEKLAEEAL